MDTGPASTQAQACGPSEPTADSSFSFTPIKAIRAIPHLWERKPSTPFQAGAKSRKLWKRFQSSFTSMKSLESSTMLEQGAFQTAINASRDAGYTRGVKRRCVGADEPEMREDHQTQTSGRSFLETKWASDMKTGQKRRKLPDGPIDIFDESLQKEQSSFCSTLDFDISGRTVGEALDGASDAKEVEIPAIIEPMASEDGATADVVAKDENDSLAPTPQEAVRDLTQQQEGTLVRSALRSSLDGADTALLNDFLSKAQAKRAAKAALMDQEGDANEKTSSTESTEESPDTEITTPRSRRALEVLDTNSPSPIKVDASVIKAAEIVFGNETHENAVAKAILEEEPAPASPSYRRSTRAKGPSVKMPTVRNTIALRRAKGNEFIFLQRTEAQELALITKKYTRQNMGNALPPQDVLKALAKEQYDGTHPAEIDRKADRRRSPGRKTVTWNDEQLVQYADERQSLELPEEIANSSNDDVEESTVSRSAATRAEKKASAQRSSRSQTQESSSNEDFESAPASTTAPATAPTTAPPRSRRVRRLGDSTMASGTPVKTGSRRTTKPPAPSAPTVEAESAGPSTPTKPRRRLTPKSPSSSVLTTAPASKITGATEPSFVSGIPTRSAGTSDGSSESRRSIQSSAGCTPRRVRTR
ncbi:hypothetical protein N7466_004476 [Penicillium verhagenii]|uniref:uncharacterized protein n=1 Tax=Penicillium verhagenii TaxID=1562060 RepID=UPI002544EA19|nr:uncharacterized protein N7466_004476 [Penicillium verhagenii]KAJ5934929.1 hypothetical protein N7466_004476 [Penicillium verhagenii]